MKQRSVGMVIFLSFITLGIYPLFWMHDTRKEMLARGAKDIPSVWLLAVPAVISVLLIMTFLIILVAGSVADSSLGIAAFVPIIGYMVATVIWTGVLIYWLYKYSQAVDYVTKGQVSFTLSFALGLALLFFGLFFVWPGIIQDGFNKVGVEPVIT